MKIRTYNLFLVLILVVLCNCVFAETEQEQEYKVKAAFIYNFIKFIEWPPTKLTDEKTISVGIIGSNSFGKSFEPIENKKIGEKTIAIEMFNSIDQFKLTGKQIDNIRKCHVLFICGSEKKQFKEIINIIKDHNVLTVGDTKGFLESGGIINFLIEDQKVSFEINNYIAKQSKLNVRSQLLRLAKKVVEEKSKDGN
ncbi:MAG: YfiR family protein [Sedimentisphaerales bacterium]|nr:YfiR family protein [Sedimentisphaerales bacterium]